MPRVMTEAGDKMLKEYYPPFMWKSDLIRAICNAASEEFLIQETQLAYVQANTIPLTINAMYSIWEDLLHIPHQDTADPQVRKTTIMAFLQRTGITGAGTDWIRLANVMFGTGWTYTITDPNHSVVILTLPLVQDTLQAALAETLLRTITPASVRFDVSFGGGFILDESRMDEDIL